jgi:hypothetical protein
MFDQLVAAQAAPNPGYVPEPAPLPRPYDPTGNGNHDAHEEDGHPER